MCYVFVMFKTIELLSVLEGKFGLKLLQGILVRVRLVKSLNGLNFIDI